MNWSPQQSAALDAVGRWLRARDRPIFYLAGYAGTGKTTLARHLADQQGGAVLFGAFTGKAARVMRQRGCEGATTLHALAYRAREKSHERARRLHAELDSLVARLPNLDLLDEIARLRREYDAERKRLRAPAFELSPDSPLRGASLLVVDECSMVDERLGEDVLSFDVPVLVLGDPAQLPPVRGSGYFTGRAPDATLTEVHRQALDSPVLALATAIREGRRLEVGGPEQARVLRLRDFDPDAVPVETQVVVGKNETRKRANTRIRRRLGFPEGIPVAGDRLVCLRNDHQAGLLNGGTWEVVSVAGGDGDDFALEIRDEETTLAVVAHACLFRGEEPAPWAWRDAQAFDFGYALTAHKAQGSEWPSVLVVDESRCFRADARAWLYTAVTRARDQVQVVVP